MKQHWGWLMLTCALMEPIAARADVTCTATVTGIAFGGYNPLASADDDSSGNIGVACTPTSPGAVSYTIGISAGSGSLTTRQLVQGNQSLGYNLFLNATRVEIWGDGTAGTTMVSDSYTISQTVVSRTYGVYGRIPARQNKPAGSYADLVTVTVTY
jgi:spore coat protein U-like protein